MKKIYAIIALMFTVVISEAQSLPNTTWAVYYPPDSTLFTYFHFGNDTLFGSHDNVIYGPRSTYQENGDTFRIVDIQPSSCSIYIGEYTFSIHNDTLDFNLINDDCPTGRSGVISFYYWVNITTGISSPDFFTKLNIFPNPASTLLNIHHTTCTSPETLLITDLLGTVVYKETLTGIDNIIPISTWSAGIYFYEVRGTEGSVRGKFVKEL